VHNNHIKKSLPGIFEKLFKNRTFSNRFGMSRPAFFPVNSDRFPASGFTELIEKPLLGIQGMAFYLRRVGNPLVICRPGCHVNCPSFFVFAVPLITLLPPEYSKSSSP
jgi:hypothetical protein